MVHPQVRMPQAWERNESTVSKGYTMQNLTHIPIIFVTVAILHCALLPLSQKGLHVYKGKVADCSFIRIMCNAFSGFSMCCCDSKLDNQVVLYL